MMYDLLRRAAMHLHVLHDRAYTFWKVREAGDQFVRPLGHEERRFYLQLRPALTGRQLVVFDIGASGGQFSSCMAKLKNVAAVHAFEPRRSAFAELKDHVGWAHHVVCHNIALGDGEGIIDMHVPDASSLRDRSSLLRWRGAGREYPAAMTTHTESVRIAGLDGYIRAQNLPFPDVMKLDVQGYEDRVLQGGQTALRHAQYCLLEMSLAPIYDGSMLFHDLCQRMNAWHFRLIGLGAENNDASGRTLQVDGLFENTRLLSS